ncbi:MAG TPA: ATP-binding protein [Candidatus Didemnitutus sp.]|nr:ATP-binding protein [Candidatus Didemnitutus sp.]
MALRNVPIRRKLMLVMLLTCIAVMLMMRATFFIYEYRTFREATQRELSTLGRVVAANSTAALAFENQEDASETLSALRAERHVTAAALYDRDGRLFARYPEGVADGGLPAAPGRDGYAFNGATLDGFEPVVQKDRRLGTLYLRVDAGAVMHDWIWGSLRIALAVMGAVLLIAYLISRLMERQISRPILALAETARAVTARRDYSVRAQKHGQDEVGLLTDAFNLLLVQIHAQKTALDEHAIVAITNDQGALTYVNDKFCAISGYARGELLGRDHRVVNSGTHPKEYIDGLWKTIAQGKVWHGEFCNRAKDGALYWVATTIVPFLLSDGRPFEYVAICADITGLKRAQAEILTLNRELEQRVFDRTSQLEAANRELEAFSYSVSHDLRAPLRHIDGFAQLLNTRLDGKMDDTSRRYLTTVTDSAKRLGVLIDDLLVFSRMGRTEMKRVEVDSQQLIAEVRTEFQQEIQNRRIEWSIDPIPPVLGDPAMLRQVWANLVGNALKYSRRRDVARISITHRIDPADGHVFAVQDNGAGFQMEYAGKLFGVFQRLHHANDFEGTGIGLANVRRIVERHGGRVWAEGRPDEGATFFFSLPQIPEYRLHLAAAHL